MAEGEVGKNETAVRIPKKAVYFILTLVVVLAVGFAFGWLIRPSVTGAVITPTDAGERLIGFLNAQTGGGVSLVGVEDEGYLYQIIVLYQGQEIPLYLTKDGKTMVQGIVPLTIVDEQNSISQTTEIPKSDKPLVELFVMSFCPFGNKAEDTMLPVYNLLKDKVDWSIHYIVSVSGDTIRSLHGQPETDQNIREVCVLNEYGLDKFWKFTTYVNENCGSDGSCWEEAANKNGIGVSKIQSCFDKEGIELMKAEADASSQAGASGSPTLLINGVKSSAVYQYGNSDAYKEAICSAFNDVPGECDEELSGSTGTSSGSTGTGSC